MNLLSIKNLKKYFPIKNSKLMVKALDGITLDVPENTTVGIVGESGCGKTTLGRCILRLTDVTDGIITFKDQEIAHLKLKDFRKYRKSIQVVFQNPHNALNPRMKIKKILQEPFLIWNNGDNLDIDLKIKSLLKRVHLDSTILDRYPHQLSGGQLQRIAIALSIANEPPLIVLDEPTSSLDVENTADLIDLFIDIKSRIGNSYIFISHDLHAVQDISDTVVVMYLGRIVEKGSKEDIFNTPKHPYTKALLASMLNLEDEGKTKIPEITGEIPSPINLPEGCYFHSRCPQVMNICQKSYPQLVYSGSDHYVYCHLYG
ncbi:MAG: ABC transporter ATP-binding protein [Candidatus Atribacteria bacterium]|nr:ABC transporter ATP-binding protein [Candidatus Atribacteria bacterium]